MDQNTDNQDNVSEQEQHLYPLNIMDFKHPIVNGERKIIGNHPGNSLYIKRENIEICVVAHPMINNHLHISRSVIPADEVEDFIDGLNGCSRLIMWIYEGFVDHSVNHCGHSYTKVTCNYVPSCNCHLYFDVKKMEPCYTTVR